MNDSPMPRPAYVPPSADVRPAPSAPRKRGRPIKPLDHEGERIKLEREEFRRAELAAIARVDPACEVEGDPPVKWCVPKVVAAEPTGVILDLARKSGRGLSGSRLVLASRYYDGSGPAGGEPQHTVTVHVVFRDAGANLRRTQGVAVHADELRAVAAALTVEAERLGVAK
jgi:hypothetical protein